MPASILHELSQNPVFAGLPEDGLAWLSSQMKEVHLAPGEVFLREGGPADRMLVVLEGELRARTEHGPPDGSVYMLRAGQVSGMLPFSRMTRFSVTSRAVMPTRLLWLSTEYFPEMLARMPELGSRLVGVMADRIREVTKQDLQREKLMALGKLSAGLAHELNNPAAAAQRAAETLHEALCALREANSRFCELGPTVEQLESVARLESAATARLVEPPVMDSLTQSDREEQMTEWLTSRQIPEAWRLAPSLVRAGVTQDALATLTTELAPPLLGDALIRLTATLAVNMLLREIQSSTGRISELVQAVKEYSYMDQASEQEIDIHRGLESTLTMLQHRLKKGINVTRQYDCSLPRVKAYGSELNQVWTNLIDNAIDAMRDKGELCLQTRRELDWARVDVIDDGPGIPQEIQERVFEPFFTTKDVGEGMGLGLDMVYRIVRKHRGEVRFDTHPGRTCFQVRLPLAL